MLGQCPDVAIVGEATNGIEAIPLITELRPDVLFLDLEMPGMTGPQLVGHLKGARAPLIVFVTAHDDYAVKAFEVEAVHYLMKPVALARLREALDRVQERLDAPSAPEPPPAPRPDLDRIPIVPLAGGRHTVVLRNGQTLPVSRIQSRILRSTLQRL